MERNMTKKRNITGYAYLILVFVLWGSLYVVSKYVLGKMPTFTISCMRFTLAFAALSLFELGNKNKTKKEQTKDADSRTSRKNVDKKAVPYILLIGVIGYFLAVGAQLLGTKYAGASIASLINALNPITMMMFAALILHEKLTVKKVLGIILAVAGVYIILGKGAGNISITGIMLSIFAVIVWSLVSVFTREATQKYESLQITRYAVGVAAVCYLPVSIYEVVTNGGIHMDISCVLSLSYMGVVCTGVAYLLWNKSLSMLEAGTCSSFYPIQPLVSSVLGIVFLQEAIGMSFWAGAVCIAAGVIISLRSTK